MIRAILLSALFLLPVSSAMAQPVYPAAPLSGAAAAEPRYVPFPPGFDQLPQADKDAALASVDSNSEIYFRSKEYGYLLTRFVHLNDPGGIRACEGKIQMLPEQNKIQVIDPLLFEKADDLHPLVGHWRQQVAFIGCEKLFSFAIDITANRAGEPVMRLETP